jgi:orotidine-5'-phosphate decarboxylase
MRFLLICTLLFLTGCTTVPVAPKFPQVPNQLLEKCPELNKVIEDPKLSDIAKTITLNYTTYYECSIKQESWIEWYNVQKQLYESIK